VKGSYGECWAGSSAADYRRSRTMKRLPLSWISASVNESPASRVRRRPPILTLRITLAADFLVELVEERNKSLTCGAEHGFERTEIGSNFSSSAMLLGSKPKCSLLIVLRYRGGCPISACRPWRAGAPARGLRRPSPPPGVAADEPCQHDRLGLELDLLASLLHGQRQKRRSWRTSSRTSLSCAPARPRCTTLP
jgi:hypothetical protein